MTEDGKGYYYLPAAGLGKLLPEGRLVQDQRRHLPAQAATPAITGCLHLPPSHVLLLVGRQQRQQLLTLLLQLPHTLCQVQWGIPPKQMHVAAQDVEAAASRPCINVILIIDTVVSCRSMSIRTDRHCSVGQPCAGPPSVRAC